MFDSNGADGDGARPYSEQFVRLAGSRDYLFGGAEFFRFPVGIVSFAYPFAGADGCQGPTVLLDGVVGWLLGRGNLSSANAAGGTSFAAFGVENGGIGGFGSYFWGLD